MKLEYDPDFEGKLRFWRDWWRDPDVARPAMLHFVPKPDEAKVE